jgi:hypothetical protein
MTRLSAGARARPRLAAAAALAATLAAGHAAATPAVALVGDRTLAFFDTTDGRVDRTVEVGGVAALAGIDLRPATGELVGLTLEGVLVRIDPATGAAAVISRLDRRLDAAAGPVVVDFNPAADKLRVIVGVENLRIDVATGGVTVDKPLAWAEGDVNAGRTPMIVAAAYSNSFGKPEKTALYDIDGALGAYLRQTKPNDGVLETKGMLGVTGARVWAFDVATDEAGADTGWMVADGVLHRVDVATGMATEAGRITGAPGPVRDLAALTAD